MLVYKRYGMSSLLVAEIVKPAYGQPLMALFIYGA
jgi:hypothetical protein